MVTVYRKSAKGQLEIETRVNRLLPRLRMALILVDGRRSDGELRALIHVDPDATLLALLEGGFIEVAATEATQAPASGAVQRPPSAPVAQQPVVPSVAMPASMPSIASQASASAATSTAGLAERRRLAVRHLTDRLGPVAEPVSLRIEKARNWEEQRAALELGQRLLQTARGGTAAAEFASLFLQAPPR